jgi:hypothetical protein
VSSFNSFHSIQQPTPKAEVPEPVRTVVHYPPVSIQAQQNLDRSNSGFASMSTIARTTSADSGEGLFAKALSPRSPDLPRSPFSFAPERVM